MAQTLAGFFYRITDEATAEPRGFPGVNYADLSVFPWSSVPETHPRLPLPPDITGRVISVDDACDGLFLACISSGAGKFRYMGSLLREVGTCTCRYMRQNLEVPSKLHSKLQDLVADNKEMANTLQGPHAGEDRRVLPPSPTAVEKTPADWVEVGDIQLGRPDLKMIGRTQNAGVLSPVSVLEALGSPVVRYA